MVILELQAVIVRSRHVSGAKPTPAFQAHAVSWDRRAQGRNLLNASQAMLESCAKDMLAVDHLCINFRQPLYV